MMKNLPIINFHHTRNPDSKYERENRERKIQWLENYIKALEKLKY